MQAKKSENMSYQAIYVTAGYGRGQHVIYVLAATMTAQLQWLDRNWLSRAPSPWWSHVIKSEVIGGGFRTFYNKGDTKSQYDCLLELTFVKMKELGPPERSISGVYTFILQRLWCNFGTKFPMDDMDLMPSAM